MTWYIKSARDGYFVGEFIGLGFFESSVQNGDCSPMEKPVEFSSYKEAAKYLTSWTGGIGDCFVTSKKPKETV